jgi:predicted dehydrogenase
MNRIFKVALVGTGIGASHAVAFRALASQFAVTLICGQDPESAAKLADTFVAAGLERPVLTSDFRDATVTSDPIDIVDICLPPFLHEEAIRRALEAGRHVICEKPLVGSLREMDELAGLAARVGRRLMPVFQYRFGNGLAKAKHLMASGAAGKIYLASIETHWTRGANYYAERWRGRKKTELGGVLTSHAIHAHDMLAHLVGDVRAVAAMTSVRVNDVETEDCAGALMEMADGSLAVSSATLGSADEISRLRICCENVTMMSNLAPYAPHLEPWIFLPKAPRTDEFIARALADAPAGPEGYAAQFARLHDSLTTGGELPVTLEQGRKSIELLTAIYHSARTGERVALPIGREHPAYAGWN